MTSTLSPRRVRRGITYGALGAGALVGPLFGAGTAAADPLSDLATGAGEQLGNIAGAVASELPDMPVMPAAPALPVPLENLMSQVQQVAPSNLLRTRSGDGADSTEAAATTVSGFTGTTYAANTAAAAGTHSEAFPHVDQQQLSQAAVNTGIQRIADSFMNAHDGRHDDNTIAQFFGAAQVPTSETLNQMGADVEKITQKITSGEIINDFRTAIDNTLASDAVAQWQSNQASIFSDYSGLTGAERASAGVAELIDSGTRDPLRMASELLDAAGGPARLVTDPLGAIASAMTQVLGPDTMSALRDDLDDLWDKVRMGVVEAAPALLAIPAMALPSALFGSLLGGLNGGVIGGTLGVLNPLNLLGIPLGAMPGALVGALITGIPGLIGSLLLGLPLLALGPLLGAVSVGGTTLFLTGVTIFALWLLSGLIAVIPAAAIAIIAGLVVAAVVAVASLLSPGIIGVLGIIPAAIALFLAIMALWYGVAAFVAVLAFMLVAPWLLIGGLLVGVGLGLLIAGLVAFIGIPLITAIAAIPGAILGAINGGLIGWATMTVINGIIGCITGIIVGAIIGGITGGVLGAIAGMITALGIIGAHVANVIGQWFGASLNTEGRFFNQLREAIERGWSQSAKGRILGTFGHELWGSETGRALGSLINQFNALLRAMTFLDGRRLKEMLLRGAILGGVPGGVIGGIKGGLLGGLLGAFSPLNLLAGLIKGAAMSIPGALIGAALGKLLSSGLGITAGLGSIPLTFLPNLLGLGLLWTLVGIFPLMALIGSLVPPLLLALGPLLLASIPLLLGVAGLLALGSLSVALIGGGTLGNIISGIGQIGSLLGQFGSLALDITGIGLPIGIFGNIASVIGTAISTLGNIGSTLMMLAGIAIPALAALAIPLLIGAVLLALPIVIPLLIGAVILGTLAVLGSLLFFTLPALGLTLLWLAGFPFLLPMALGLSILEGIAIGSLVDALSSLVTVPAGALIGAGTGFATGAVLTTLVAAAIRGFIYGSLGAAAGTGIGAVIGGVLGALAALITHTRVGAGIDTTAGVNPTGWIDARIVNKGGFGDILDFLPGLTGDKVSAQTATEAVPQLAGTQFDPRSTVKVAQELVAV